MRRYAYGYDKGGNRTSEQTDLGVSTATHNDANQLTGVSASSGPVKFAGRLGETGIVYVANALATMGVQNTSFVAYASLATGTREVEVRATDYSNQSATNRYQVVITNNGVAKTLSYDINGNLTNVAAPSYTNKYEWDGADRLIKISRRIAGGQLETSQFTYDGLGRRVSIKETTLGTSTTRAYVWCGTELCEERTSTGSSVNRRFFGQGEQISGTPYYFTRDHLGSIREMTDSAATTQARYEYDPYGRRTKVSGSSDSDFGYTGHYYHSGSGLHLTLYRAYDSDTGRWISRDPIEEEGGLNLYTYVTNDPNNWADPDGREPVSKTHYNRGGVMVHSEVPVPNGGRGGVHIQVGKQKWHLNTQTGEFTGLPKSVRKVLDNDKGMRRALNTAVERVNQHGGFAPKYGGAAYLGRWLVGLGAFGLVLSAEASAARMVEIMKTIVKDCRNGQDDWAYVGLLTLRHEVNQQTGLMGDVVMRQTMRQMEE